MSYPVLMASATLNSSEEMERIIKSDVETFGSQTKHKDSGGEENEDDL